MAKLNRFYKAMKKYLLFVCCLLVSTKVVLAQNQLGVKVAPGLSYNRLHTNPDTTNLAPDGFGMNLKLGLIYDHCIKDNYYLSTGLLFAMKGFSLQNKNPDPNIRNLKEAHALQYLQVPLLFKLYTGELALDTRIYVELGPVGAIKINERVSRLGSDQAFIKKFKPWELGGILGAGVEYKISLFTSLFAGLSYQIGLSSALDKQDNLVNIPLIDGYNDYINLEIGIKL
jgi:hypothetical protein